MCAISKNSVKYFQRRKISKVYIKLAKLKLSLANISILMYVVPLFKHTLITHTQGLFVCNIKEFWLNGFGEDVFKGLH